jgi:regulator of nonsense transcripts 2
MMFHGIVFVPSKVPTLFQLLAPFSVGMAMQAAVKGRFEQVQLVASLLSSLARYRDSLVVTVVDSLLEEIRQGLESPEAGRYQRRIAYVRLLGECYNYRVIKSQHLFFVLYLLISFGASAPQISMPMS